MFNLNAEIKGWGESELAEMLGIDVSDDSHGYFDEIRWQLKELQMPFMYGGPDKETLAAVQWIRDWLRKLTEEDLGYQAPFFLGIAAVEDEYTLIQIVSKNLGILWT